MVDTKQTLSEAYLAEYSGYESIQISIAMTFVATLFISLRFYFKLKVMGRPWGIEDTLLMAAYVAHEGLCVLGFGKFEPRYQVKSSLASNAIRFGL